MKTSFSKRRALFLVSIMILLVSSACSTGSGGSSAQGGGGNVTFGPGDGLFPDPTAGLADLTSYTATLVMSFDGTRDGSPSQWSKTYVMQMDKDLAHRQLTIEKTGDLADLSAVYMAEAGGAAYERQGTNACTATVLDQGNTLGEWMEPAGFLPGVHGAEKAGSETVSGVAADHYTFDSRALAQVDIAQSTGEMWVSPAGGYIVKYLLTTTGTADYFGEGIVGTLTLDYQLSDVNQLAGLPLPADCPAGMVNAPLLPDAANLQSVPGLLTYTTASSLADAAAFYQAQLPTLGWVSAGEPVLSDTTASLEFTQADQTMTVIITSAEGGTNVTLLLGSSQAAAPSP